MTVEELLGIEGDVVSPSAGWGNQWGSTFGGYVAAVLMHALERAVPEGQSLTTAQLGFVQPLRTEPTGRLTVDVIRNGRTATSLSGRVEQNGSTAAVALGWSSVEIDQPSRVDATRHEVRPPEEYEERVRDDTGDEALAFVGRDFDMRTVPTPNDGTLALQWMRLRRLELGEDDPWPAAGIGLVADMVGAGQFRAAMLALGTEHALLSLDLTVHLAAVPRGPWVLGVFDSVGLQHGRAIGRGELYDRSGTLVASITQLSLIRPFQ
jgi:acyl-CoA thioesterase-2